MGGVSQYSRQHTNQECQLFKGHTVEESNTITPRQCSQTACFVRSVNPTNINIQDI